MTSYVQFDCCVTWSVMIAFRNGHTPLHQPRLGQIGLGIEILQHIGQIIVVVIDILDHLTFVLWQPIETFLLQLSISVGEKTAQVDLFTSGSRRPTCTTSPSAQSAT